MKEKLKDKKVIAGLAIGVIVIISIIIFITMSMNTSTLKPKNKEVAVEYGSAISLAAKDYLNNDTKLLEKVKVESTAKNEAEKEYPAIGEYEITLTYKDQTEKVKVIIKDTVIPEFAELKENYEVEYNGKIDIKTFKTTDLSEVKITIDDTKVDYKKAGTYKAIVTASDLSDNKVEKEVNVVVKAEVKEPTTSNSKPNSTSSGSTNKPSSGGSSSNGTSKPSGGSSSNGSSKPSGGGSGGSSETEAIAKISTGAFNLQNQKRVAAGVGKLEWDNELAEIAMKRAKEISVDFNHRRWNTSGRGSASGENIGKDYSSDGSVIVGWYNSTAHKNAMLRESYTKGAIARYGNFWVALFLAE